MAESPHVVGRSVGGMLEFVVTFRDRLFRDDVWPAIVDAFEHARFGPLESLARTASGSEVRPGDVSRFLADLERWRPECRRKGRLSGYDPFCAHPNADCSVRMEAGAPMCGMRDCHRRLTHVVLQICRPPVDIGTLAARAGVDPDLICELLGWGVGEEEQAAKLFGSRLGEFPTDINRASMSVYLTHLVAEEQAAHAARATAGCHDLLSGELELTEEHLDGLERFWKALALEKAGLALCYAEP